MAKKQKKTKKPETKEPKKKLWGLLKGLKISEKEIEEAKKSLFPDREF